MQFRQSLISTLFAIFTIAEFAFAQAKPLPGSPVTDLSQTNSVDAAGNEFFEKKVRPALVKHCFACHSQSAGKRSGQLYVDSREALIRGGASGTVLVPFDPGKSRIIEAVRHVDPNLRMPPSAKLPESVIADLTKWVRMGAPWPKDALVDNSALEKAKRLHWAWQPIKPFAPPATKNKTWTINPIDQFILTKLESKKLVPVRPADRRTLLRRASFDLIGLPPTRAEVDSFISDKSPDAWAKVVDRLLASPHYGERWGRFWLDIARYGEDQAHTFEARQYPQGYRYRDWVTHALNSDMPYDKFITAQIAADLMTGPDAKEHLPALGFFATGPVYYADRKMYDQYDDRIDTLSRGFLGLTAACARCHDHKFDPISQKDYYALAGVFASSTYMEVMVETGNGIASSNRKEGIKKAQDEVDEFVKEHAPRIRKEMAAESAKYVTACWKYKNRLKVNAKLSLDKFAESEKLIFVMLERWLKWLESNDKVQSPIKVAWRSKLTAENQKQDVSANPSELASMKQISEDLQRHLVALISKHDSIESKKAAKDVRLTPEEIKEFEEIAGANGLLTIPIENLDSFLEGDPKDRFATITANLKRVKMGEFIHALAEGPKVVNCPLLIRGNPEAPSDEVPRRFLSVLSGEKPTYFQHGSGRLELAQAIADRKNPLTPRVMVNRIWQQHFGRGIVKTTSNFGILGDRPTHPELLDYLANQFIQNKWSIKNMHKMIMTSATYKLSSTVSTKNAERDPDNVYLWRMSRRRLDIEAWRDAILTATNRIDLRMGGPSQDLSSPNNFRRTCYAAVSRHDLNSMLRLFDFPDANVTSDNRVTTTVPLQQLFVLNSEFMFNQAKSLSTIVNQATTSESHKIAAAYEILFQRRPSNKEIHIGLAFLTGPQSKSNPDKMTRWEQYAQVLLGANEFMYVD